MSKSGSPESEEPRDVKAGVGKPAPHLSLSLLLPRDAASIPLVRHLCEYALAELGCRIECSYDIRLAVTEACANVIQHAGPGESYTVEVRIESDRCEMRIFDSSGSFDEVDADASVRTRAENQMSESGRGLAIIRSLADHLSLKSHPDEGTLVSIVKRLDFDEDSSARRLMAGKSS